MAIAFVNTIVIPCGSAIVSAFAQSGDDCPLFDGSNNIILRVQPGNYKPIREKKVERRDGYATAGLLVSTILLGLEVTIADGREEIRYALEALEAAAQSVPGQYTPIQLFDYCRPERQDLAAGYTLRVGYFSEIEGLGGTVRTVDNNLASRRYGNGVRFTFYEGNRR